MARRLAPVALVLAAVAADARGLPGPAFLLLVTALPVAAACALSFFGELVETPARSAAETALRLETSLAALGFVLLVLVAALRGNAAGATPELAGSALVACLGVYAIQAAAAVVVPVATDEPAPEPTA